MLRIAWAFVVGALMGWLAFQVAFRLRMAHLRVIYPDDGQISLDAAMVGVVAAAITMAVAFLTVMIVSRPKR